ncbi:MAG: DUF5606 domain-containing protein [Bacteroidales bacterium]|nr:DUF5606 domain-containing protein [Bacteroidales bacterium]
MLKTILSISGKPGLFKLISQAKNIIFVESISDHKRIPVHSRDKVVSLGDIAIYTTDEEVPLSTVMDAIKNKENGKNASIPSNASADELRDYLGSVLPNFDRDRVYPSDIKKLITWYNLLINAGLDDFVEKTEETEEKKTEE